MSHAKCRKVAVPAPVLSAAVRGHYARAGIIVDGSFETLATACS